MYMNIWMMTNTFTPFVGGVARSVVAFAGECRKAGHRVVIVAPVFEGMPPEEEDVIRVPALQDFNGSDFSLALPAPGILSPQLEECRPDIVHSHHPHLLGNTAVRIACRLGRPLVFTHHTMYEYYLHYVPTGASRLREFVIALVTGYCNSVRLRHRTQSRAWPRFCARGAYRRRSRFSPPGWMSAGLPQGDGPAFRRSHRIPQKAFVAGYVGRLAPEKNLAVSGGGGEHVYWPRRDAGTFWWWDRDLPHRRFVKYSSETASGDACTWWDRSTGRTLWMRTTRWMCSSSPRAVRPRAWC